MKGFKAISIKGETVREMKAQLHSEFERVCSEDGLNFDISQDTTNGVSFYVTFWAGEHPPSWDKTQIRISDHVCGGHKARNFMPDYKSALAREKREAVDIIETPVYHTREVAEDKIRDTDTNVSFSRIAKKGHKLFEVTRKMAHNTTTVIRRKKGPANIQMPQGLGVKTFNV